MNYKIIISILLVPVLTGCSSVPRFTSKRDEGKTVQRDIGISGFNDKSAALETVTGTASYYADKYNGRETANGEIFNMYALTAAHETYPFNTIVRVTNLSNGKSAIIRINDRKPEFKNRIIDLSYKAAEELGMLKSGITKVKLEVLKWGRSE